MRLSKRKTTILSGQDVQEIVQHYGIHQVMDALISRMSTAFKAFDPAKTNIPTRSGFNYNTPDAGLVEWMPLHGKDGKVMIKIVGYHPRNPEKYNLPTILSTLSAYDTNTGHLSGVIDGVLLTALRTGAASALASELLADPDSSVLGLIGCGAQSVTQLHALSRKFNFKRILIYDIDNEAISSFEDRCAALEVEAVIVPAAITEIVATADILCTATSVEVGKGPLFSDLISKPWLHINAVGADFPGKVELPLGLLEKSFVCPDFREQAVLEGECQQLDKAKIGPDLAELVQNHRKYLPVRKRLSVFDSTGWALEDEVAMDLFLEYAFSLGLGREIEIEFMPDDVKNPYHFIETPPVVVRKNA